MGEDLKKYKQYAEAVVMGREVAGKLVKQACARYLSFFERDDMYFDTAAADKPVNFIRKLKHTDGEFAGQKFEPLPWQEFMIYGMFGFKWRESKKRVVRNAYIQISRKNAKTSTAAALALYMLIADGEPGAEVDFVSPSAEQTRIGLRAATNYAESINRGGILRCMRNTIEFTPTKSRIRMMTSDAKLGDGFFPHFAVIDEYHALPNNDIPNVMQSGMGARRQPMIMYITTAGFNVTGPCKEYRDMCAKVLAGEAVDDSLFALVYELDEDDDWKDPKVWRKACPSLGAVVNEDYMQAQVTLASNNTSMETGVRVKNLNQWVQTSEVWLTDDDIRACMEKVTVDDFRDESVWAGIDLAAVSDLTVASFMMPPSPYRDKWRDKFVFKSFVWLPSDELKRNVNAPKYKEWARRKYIRLTDGNVTDYDAVFEDMREMGDACRIEDVAYDAWNSTQFVIKATEAGFPMTPFSQSLGNFNKPTKEFERLLKSGRVVIDDSPVTRWCFSNVVLKSDYNENVKPSKNARQLKIDIVIAMLEALGSYMVNNATDITVV